MNNLKLIPVFFVLLFYYACNIPEYDVVITGGTIYDGQGGEPYISDIAVKDGRIVRAGSFEGQGKTVIDATGLIVAPGFIDMHTHIDRGIVKPERSAVKNYLTQGVTTVVTGNCGSGTFAVANYFAHLDSIGIGPNVVHLIGHGTVRRQVMGMADKAANADELAAMTELVVRGMEQGAVGMSSGLFYAPGSYASVTELTALAKAVGRYKGIYASHIRDESNYNIGLEAAIAEAIAVGEQAGVPVQISHIKALGAPVWGKAPEVCALIEAARERGVKVMADQYPYTASSTSLSAAVIPRWAQEGGKLPERLASPDIRQRIEAEMAENIARRGGPESLLIVSYAPNHNYDGLSLGAISEQMGMSPVATAIALISEGHPSIVSFNMQEEDLAYFMQQEYVMTSSDGSVQVPGAGVPHPRSYGTFPRKIRKYVIEDSLITMAGAIRAATYLPARMLGLADRGVIEAGNVADIVIFEPATISDAATFRDPHQYSRGIAWLLVNGEVVIANGVYNGKLAGKSLRMNEYR